MSEKQYTVALRKRVEGDRFFQHKDFQFNEARINTKGRYWLADPFLFEKENKVYLFYESFDLVVRKGYIGYSVLQKDGSFSEPKMVLTKGCHKSFPFIFERNGQVFIMPESCEDYDIKLYKAVHFPDIWKEERELVSGVFSTDSIIFNKDNIDYLLTSEQYRYPREGQVVSCWVKNRLYKFGNDLSMDPDKATGVIVAEGEEGIRNAGRLFLLDGRMIRPGQNCQGGVYGKGLKFFEVDSIEPYKEKVIYSVDADEMQSHIRFVNGSRKIIGTHTYNSSENYEVIDLSYKEDLRPSISVEKTCRHVLVRGKHGAKKAFKLANRALRKVENKARKEEIYEARINPDAPWVFVSYIADPFYHKNDEQYLNRHQNKREALAMADVFNKLGYNAYFMLYTSNQPIPDYDFKVVFGHEPGCQRALTKCQNAKLIHYGVSVYYDFRNKKIKEMTDSFNKAFNANIPERRLVEPHDAVSKADAVLLIGSDITVSTYPNEYQSKITKIHQSTQVCNYLRNIDAENSKEFLYLASSGNILKGSQSIVEYFSSHKNYELHWVGPIEEDVRNAIESHLTSNIHTYGYQDISSNLVLGLMERCNFMVYPSGVEGGPGSVLNAMKSGLIPLVTPWASFDGIENLGYVMEDSTAAEVGKAVDWAMSLSKDEVLRRKKACQKFVLENYNLEEFTKEFENFMRGHL